MPAGNYKKKNEEKFFLASLKSPKKRVGFGLGSGSIIQRHGSADPDPHQKFMDPQHWILLNLISRQKINYFSLKIFLSQSVCYDDKHSFLHKMKLNTWKGILSKKRVSFLKIVFQCSDQISLIRIRLYSPVLIISI